MREAVLITNNLVRDVLTIFNDRGHVLVQLAAVCFGFSNLPSCNATHYSDWKPAAKSIW